MSRKEVYCENCDSYQPMVEHEPRTDERNSYPWYDITCSTCAYIVATVQIVPDDKPVDPSAIAKPLLAAKKDVWFMRRELESRIDFLEALVKQNHLDLQ